MFLQKVKIGHPDWKIVDTLEKNIIKNEICLIQTCWLVKSFNGILRRRKSAEIL